MTTQRRFLSPYNTVLEAGLRSLFIFAVKSEGFYDLQRLCYYDYLLVHSGDFEEGPKSLHPAIPLRSGEFIVRRRLIDAGLTLYLSRGLIERRLRPSGIEYSSSQLTGPFLDHFTSDYAKRLKENAAWVVDTFEQYTNDKLQDYFRKHIDQWGNEFVSVPLLEEEWTA